jgi:tetratricopeptide (TPR) repeat protein
MEQGPIRRESVLRRHRSALLIIAAAVLIVFGQTLRFDFVNYDDQELIVENAPLLSNPANIAGAFSTHVFAGHRQAGEYYRPILTASYIIDYQLWQLRPFGYHLTNLLLHLLTAAMVYLLALSVFNRRSDLALFSALVFAVHPVQTEAVAWLAGRNDLLLGFFIVAMMLCYAHFRESGRKIFGLLAILAYTLALFTKESAVAFSLLPLLYDYAFHRSSLRKTIAPLAVMAVITACYLIVRQAILGSAIGLDRLAAAQGAWPERLSRAPGFLMENLRLIVAPFRLSASHPVETMRWTGEPWLGWSWAIIAALAAATLWSWRRNSPIFFGLKWLFLGLILVLNIVPLAVPLLEHRLYVPMIGGAVILAGVVGLLDGRLSRRSAGAAAVALLLLFGVLSFARLPVWHDSEALWNDTLQKEPSTNRAYINLAGYYFERLEYGKVTVLLEEYLRRNPGDQAMLGKLRQTYFLMQRFQDAALVCRRMITLSPHSQNRYLDAGLLYERISQPDSAAAIYREGLRVDSTFYQLHARLGLVLEGAGQEAAARQEYTTAFGQLERAMSREPAPPRETGDLRQFLEKKLQGPPSHNKNAPQ